MSSGKKSRTENHSFFSVAISSYNIYKVSQKICFIPAKDLVALPNSGGLPLSKSAKDLVALPNSGDLLLSKFAKDLVASPNSGDLPLSKFTKDFFALPLVRYRCSGYESGIIV